MHLDLAHVPVGQDTHQAAIGKFPVARKSAAEQKAQARHRCDDATFVYGDDERESSGTLSDTLPLLNVQPAAAPCGSAMAA